MKISVRNCRLSDASSIRRLNREEMGYEVSAAAAEKQLRKLLKQTTDRIVIAEAAGIVVGYIHVNDYDLLYAPHRKNIMGFAVAKAFRRQGVGKMLLREIEAWARATNAAAIRLVSGESRTEAHEAYKRCGFIPGHQQLHFTKTLSN